MVKTSVGRFSSRHLVFDPVLSPVLTVRTGLRTDLQFSHEQEPVVFFFWFFFGKNQTGFLKEPPSGFEYLNLRFKVPKQQHSVGRQRHYLGLGILYKNKAQALFFFTMILFWVL